MSKRDKLTEEQWALIEPLLPSQRVRADGRGRPWKNNREVLNGIIWILRSGARWKDLPKDFPSYQTCHRRFQQWVSDGTLREILEVLARDLEERGEIDLQESFIDGSFAGAKKGGLESGKPSVANRANRYAIARGSTLECGAILDALLTLSLVPEAAHSNAKILLVRIASMLSKLSRLTS